MILNDLQISQQIMRPIFLQQFIFAGFMCCTSIFFFFDTIGYRYLEQVTRVDFQSLNDSLLLLAKCQRMSLLAHCALVTGMLIGQGNYNTKMVSYKPIGSMSLETWTIRIGVITFLISLIIQSIPGLFQFSIGLYNVAIFCGAVVFTKGITGKNEKLIIWGGTIFVSNVLNSTLTGYKEPVIVNFIIIACLLYPYFKKQVILLALPFFIGLFYVAPTYSTVIRQQSWTGETSAEEARDNAIESILFDDELSIEDTNWGFLTIRFSEISMFTKFAKSTPETIPYYNLDIIENSLIALVPRALWKEKPVTEEIAMQRVYDAGVVDSRSKVSAKARPIVDGYLSGGAIGVFIYMITLGLISQTISNKTERLFGGYEPGCIIFFNGFYQILWRGESTEFMVNSVFWAFVAMIALFAGLRLTNHLERVQPNKIYEPEIKRDET